MNYKVPLFWPYIPKSVFRELPKTLRSRWIGQGTKVNKFEKAIGAKFNLKYPLMTNAGTSALELAYDLIGIKAGDEVISSALTCTATNIPLLRRGAKIVFADIDPHSLVITNETVKKVLTNKTKAIVGVSLGGIKCDLTGFDIPVIIDAAQAIGHNNGDYMIYSFQAIKHFTTVDGGLLNLPNEEEYQKAKKMRWFGIDRDRKKRSDWQIYKEREMTFDIELLGYKFQPTDVDATLGLCGLQEYDNILKYRKRIFDFYKQKLEGYHGIEVVDGKDNVYWLATLLVDDRETFVKKLQDKGIETNLVQVRNDLFKIFGGQRLKLPNLDSIEERYISIPLNMKMTFEDVKYIVKSIKEIYG